MNTTEMPPAQWAEHEFASAQLGDRRRTHRLVKIATRLVERPGGTLPQAMPDWKETKAAYRFFTQLQGGGEPIQRAHWERTRAQCQQPGEYLLIEDTSELDYTGHVECEGLGSIGNGGGRGLLLHSALALRVEAWDLEQRPEAVVVGLAWQKCWSRAGQLPRRKQPWRQRMSRPRESQRWAQGFKQWGRPATGCHWLLITDREGDFYDPIHLCQRQGIDFIIRAYRDRRLADSPEHLLGAVAQMPVRGTMRLELRARPGQAARTAVVQVRSGTVALHGPERPGGKLEDFTLQVVEGRELGAPAGVEPLHWLLLTSRPCQKWAQVQRIVSCYASRW